MTATSRQDLEFAKGFLTRFWPFPLINIIFIGGIFQIAFIVVLFSYRFRNRNLEVWHGSLDIIVNDDLALAAFDDCPDSPGQEAPVEVKTSSEQIMAETIVFSFLQKQKHPEKDHFLCPCIGIGDSEMTVMLYDSQHDVFLHSDGIPILRKDGILNPILIIVAWLVVNHKYLCTGLTEAMKTHQSNFFIKAGEKLDVYRENLIFRDVGKSSKTNKSALIEDQPERSDFLFDLHKQINELVRKRELEGKIKH